jgi:hypothetical protein
MPYTKEFIFTIPEGKTLYQSETITNKMHELRTSGDLISVNVVTISPTQKKSTMVWKDINAFETWTTWFNLSGEKEKAVGYMSTNNIVTD